MTKRLILVADDDAAVRMVVNQALMRAGFSVRVTSNFSTLWQWIENGDGDCVISDVIMPDGDAFEVLPRIKAVREELPVILISAQNTFMTALKAHEGEAFEYLPKPFDLDKLVQSVERALSEPRGASPTPPSKTYAGEMPIIGRSEQMQKVYQAIAKMRHSNLPIMLQGESGTGKSLIARVLHDYGDRAGNGFEKLTLSGMSAPEIEQVMFGADGHSGIIAKLSGGTLFFNEVLDMPTQIQARVFQWLGSMEDAKDEADVRVISATSDDLEEAIRSGRFREDLYYRLSVVPLTFPPLRERREDVPDLARHFLKKEALVGAVANHIEPEGMNLLKEHNWPGNVRELENLISRLCLLHPKESLSENDLSGHLKVQIETEQSDFDNIRQGFSSLSEATKYFADRYFDPDDVNGEGGDVYAHFLSELEEPLIIAALRATNGNQIKAADILGLNRNTLRKKIKAHNIRIVKTVGR